MTRIGVSSALGALLLALVCGVVVAIGLPVVEVLFVGLLVCGIALVLPERQLVLAMLLLTFVVQGSLSYFMRLPQAAWLPYMAGMLLVVRWLLRTEVVPTARLDAASMWWSGPGLLLTLYLLTLCAAILVNRPSGGLTLIGLKNAIPIWIAAVFFVRGQGGESFDRLVWRALVAVLILQLPVVAYQHFVIVPARADVTTAMDAVVGTFGGLIDAGGANGTLVLFALVGMAYSAAMFSRGQWSLGRTAMIFIAALFLIFAGEVKAALVWIPLTLILVNRRKVFRSVSSLLAITTLVAVLMGTLFFAYDAMYWSKSGDRSAGDRIERMAYFFDASNINYSTGEISRGASVALWLGDSTMPLANRMVGFGPGSSRISATGGLGEVAKRFAPLNVAATGVSMLLWDTGLFGLIAFSLFLIALAWQYYRVLATNHFEPAMAARGEALAAFVVLALSTLFYNRSLLDEPSMQLLLAMAFGYCVRMSRMAFPSRAAH